MLHVFWRHFCADDTILIRVCLQSAFGDRKKQGIVANLFASTQLCDLMFGVFYT
jgi:hypothetical protein